ncbi:MAG: hypothetical protein AAGI34_04225 [Pseudomonadota bacterium]
MRAPAWLAVLALTAGCAATPEPAPAPPPPAPVPAATTAATTGPFSVDIALDPLTAQSRTEALAVSCWLDPVLEANAIVVDRRARRIFVTDEARLLEIAITSPAPGQSSLSLSGPVLDDAAIRAKLQSDLSRNLTAPEPTC